MGYPQTANMAYATLATELTDPGRAEALVFARVTRHLRSAFDADPITAGPARARALHDNRRLWRAAASACADDTNALPEDLRAALLGLAGFVDRTTTALLRGEGSVSPLIEINQRMANGLTAGAR
ncbi:flagellar biosynthesis regulator FlaF [Jannaschia sp. KMU-145]|uniref:flagellar biosynthesis regulator FlaF n=1 Tax=Jannaschia halovivens TaxID=3388667 RepID=UPI00396B3028